jgi:hypothetical protein
MQRFILEICDADHASLCEPVFLEHTSDLPWGVKQAVEDFLEAHDGALTTPLVITARQAEEQATPCFPLVDTLAPLTPSRS